MRKKHSRSRKHRYLGGYSSASTYQEYVNGNNVSDQMNRTFNPNVHDNGNLIIGAQGQNATLSGTPSASQLSLVQSAGKHRKVRKGGNLGAVLSQAAVPFSLLGMQQSYRTRRHKGGKSKKTRRRH
jgi:ribosomal protein L28